MAKQNLKKLIKDYLKEGRMLMIATSKGNQPWNATVYYAADTNLNLYWISKPQTRHSQEIEKNKKVAGVIPIKFDNLVVVGVQLEGEAALVTDSLEIKKGAKLYCDKFNRGEDWLKDFLAGNNPHKLYRIKITKLGVFDRVNFPELDRQDLPI